MSDGRVIAVDLGATSGRVILGEVSLDGISMQTTARFANRPLRMQGRLHWDVLSLWRGVLEGVSAAAREGAPIASVGVDSWGVDYALLRAGRLLGNPVHYRDDRSLRGAHALLERVDPADLFASNGLQHMPINTINQLASGEDALLDAADTLLLIPDLFAHLLSGAVSVERTNASTTGLLNAGTAQWSPDLARLAGLSPTILPPLVDAGTALGGLRTDVREETGLGGGVEVIAVGSHDTASAVVAVPMDAAHAAYISCGTWGLVGVEVAAPVLCEAVREASFTNEIGVDGRVRLLHNVMGLWLLSETVRWWERVDGGVVELAPLLAEAAAVRGHVDTFDVDDDVFLAPGDMPTRIAAWYTERGRRAPSTRAEITRSIVESLARTFADSARRAGRLGGVDVREIHLVGGGALNALLCQRTADLAGLPVFAGPVEATAIGNLLVQARTSGRIVGSLDALRDIVRRTHSPVRFDPRP